LESNDHPEIDSSKFLGEDDVQKSQSLIGAMQWAISIGHFDIAVHVMTMSSFRASPRHGHLEQVKRMVGYLSKFRFAELRILTDEPDFSDISYATTSSSTIDGEKFSVILLLSVPAQSWCAIILYIHSFIHSFNDIKTPHVPGSPAAYQQVACPL
jgi:hypothetical protein